MEFCILEPATLQSHVERLTPRADEAVVSPGKDVSSLSVALANQAKQSCGTPFLLAASRCVTFGEANQYVATLASLLNAWFGSRPGERVIIALPNSPEYVVAYLAVMAAGKVAVPVPVDIEANRLREIIQQTSPVAILTNSIWASRFRKRATESFAQWQIRAGQPPTTIPADLAAIFFTSGSTGTPKGVMLTHGNLVSNAQSITEYLQLTPSDRAAMVVPFYHALGNSILTSHLLAGASLVTDTNVMFPEALLDSLEEHCATSVSGVPTVFHQLLEKSSLRERSLPALRYMSVAGGMLNLPAVHEMRTAIAPAQFVVMYGQTEATARLAWLPHTESRSRAGSIGRAVPGVKLRIADDDGRHLASGKTGELIAYGPNIAHGYWNDSAASAATFCNGWLHTGDVGHMDSEGFIYLSGRRSSFVKRFGFRLHPGEIDEFLLARFGLRESVTIVVDSDGETGLAVFAQPQSGTSCSADEIRAACAAALPGFKQPDYVEVVHEFPLNDALKIDHLELRQRVPGQQSSRTENAA
jgi:long-chain acyl-CoA synthetase